MERVTIAGVAAAALLTAGAGDAAADRGFSIGSRPVWFLTGGSTAGGTVAADARGGFVGGELSLVRVRESRFLGLYGDAYYDFGVEGTYVTIGPEVGWIRRSRSFPFGLGVDGGGAIRLGDDTALGATGRVFVSLLGTLSIYGRYAYLDADEDDHVVQIGVTLKFPLPPPFGAGAP
jgi:hypothetical protein